MRFSPVALALAGFAVACAPASEPPADAPEFTAEDEAAIRGMWDVWGEAWVNEDVDALVSLVTPDYVEARATALVGPDALGEMIQNTNADYTSIETTVERVEGDGDLAWAWVSGTNRYMRRQQGDHRVQNWNSVWILKRGSDGEWRFAGTGWGAAARPDSTAAGAG